MRNYSELSKAAAQELLRRQRSRNSLVDFAKAIDVPGRPVSEDPDEWLFSKVETGLAEHHVLILEVIEKVMLGEIPRAMLFLPPGSAKSSYASVVAPTWAMGKFPGTKIILASYGSDLARKHGRRARQIAKSPIFKDIFNTTISAETSAADEWALTNGSEYLACGILSGITGNRAVGVIVDDAVKGRQEADSETVQARTWDVYQEDLRTRLIPGGWELIIQTRWSEQDISGKILPADYDGESGLIRCRDGRDWYIVCIPAQCDRQDDLLGRQVGEYLWPEWFSEEHFAPFKTNVRTWNALFQQRPQPEQGTYFQREWFHRYEPNQTPSFLNIYGASDYAVSEDEGDFTEHGVLGIDHINDIWVMDWWSGQTEADVWIKEQLKLIKNWKPFCWFGEKGQIKKAVAPFFRVMMNEAKAYCRVEWIPSVVNKVIRARSFQGMAASGKIHIPAGAEGDAIIDQLLRFPTGSHDDKVDVLSLFCLAMDQSHPAILPFVPEIHRVSMAKARIDHVEKIQQPDMEQSYLMRDKQLEEEYLIYGDKSERREYYHDIS
jgi:hypothetical protein